MNDFLPSRRRFLRSTEATAGEIFLSRVGAFAHAESPIGQPEVEVDFVADNPGLTLVHCHQQLHMDFGFMTLFDYV